MIITKINFSAETFTFTWQLIKISYIKWKFKNIKYYVLCGGRCKSATVNIYGDITSKNTKTLIGSCSICKRKFVIDC